MKTVLENGPVTRKGVLEMAEMTLGRNGRGKYLRPVILLSLVFLLMWSTLLWAGPMGDPEPVGANDKQAPGGSPDDPEPSAQEVPTTVSDIELTITLLGALL
jgi:hypothetical protein